jgi:prepilin-type N-terminal cleavage/methylation domain-containing protein
VPARKRRAHGFTLLEVAVTMAIVGILAALAAIGMQRFKPRANLSSSASQLTALFNAARQNSLATGHDTVVMVFPQFQNPTGGTGRVVLYEDANYNFFSTTAIPNFSAFNPADPTVMGARGEILETLDLPLNVTVGLGGFAAPTLAAPYNLVAASACSFCASGGDGRGAVVFNARGRALFYTASGAALAAWGGTVALQGPADMPGYRLVIVTSTTGSVRAINNG